jgi:hypothetical protein
MYRPAGFCFRRGVQISKMYSPAEIGGALMAQCGTARIVYLQFCEKRANVSQFKFRRGVQTVRLCSPADACGLAAGPLTRKGVQIAKMYRPAAICFRRGVQISKMYSLAEIGGRLDGAMRHRPNSLPAVLRFLPRFPANEIPQADTNRSDVRSCGSRFPQRRTNRQTVLSCGCLRACGDPANPQRRTNCQFVLSCGFSMLRRASSPPVGNCRRAVYLLPPNLTSERRGWRLRET